MALTGHPPHGSGRAELPHPALVSGSNVQSLRRIRMANMGIGQPFLRQAVHPFPGNTAFLASPSKAAFPELYHLVSELYYGVAIERHPIVLGMPSDYCRQPAGLLWDWPMHPVSQFMFDRLQFGLHTLAHRLPFDHEASFPGRPTVMSKPQKVERFGFAFSPSGSVGRSMSSKLDQPGFLGVQFQAELLQSFC